MLPKVWNIFEKNSLVTHSNVIEQDEVLVNLPHITNMWYDGNIKFPRHKTDRDKLADATQAHTVGLHKTSGARLKIIFENDLVRDMFAKREF